MQTTFVIAALLGLGAYNLQGCGACTYDTIDKCGKKVATQEDMATLMRDNKVAFCKNVGKSMDCFTTSCCEADMTIQGATGEQTMKGSAAAAMQYQSVAAICADLKDPCAKAAETTAAETTKAPERLLEELV